MIGEVLEQIILHQKEQAKLNAIFLEALVAIKDHIDKAAEMRKAYGSMKFSGLTPEDKELIVHIRNLTLG